MFLRHGLNALLCSNNTMKRHVVAPGRQNKSYLCVLRVFNSNPKSERSEEESETSSNTPNLCVICQLLSRGLLLSAIRV